jgi:Lrp/AsnC family leucine-responsive transcriptional regulator
MIIMSSDNSEIDQFDRKILSLLSRDGRMSVSELARRIGLSKTPAQLRMNRLIKNGYIRGFRAEVDPERLGLDHIAFVEVKLRDTSEQALSEFNKAVRDIPAIEQCHMIAGAFDYLLKVRTRDIKGYRQVLGERISALPHVASTSTHVSMQSVKESGFTPAR